MAIQSGNASAAEVGNTWRTTLIRVTSVTGVTPERAALHGLGSRTDEITVSALTGGLTMETPAGNAARPGPGDERSPEGPAPSPARAAAGGPRATVLGSLTIPGRPEQVSLARAFVAQTFGSRQVKADADTATLLTSEIVTNAIQHTQSGADGGTVTIVVIGVAHGVLVEIIDDGSAGAPIVKGDLYAAEGHGLFLVQQLATEWGYLKDPAGTTVWFHLPIASEAQQAAVQADPPAGRDRDHHGPARNEGRAPGSEPYQAQPTQLWAAASSAAASA
jgi:anti-sigma regulatory factor (Ser/Thr protein kinase)